MISTGLLNTSTCKQRSILSEEIHHVVNCCKTCVQGRCKLYIIMKTEKTLLIKIRIVSKTVSVY